MFFSKKYLTIVISYYMLLSYFKGGQMKRITPITIDETVYNAIKELAQSHNRSVSNYIETLLKKHIQEKKDE